MLFKWFLFLPSIYLEYVNAAKCNAPPTILQRVQLCCPIPMPNWAAYTECANSGNEPSCRLSCILNTASVLRGDRLNLARVRPMLDRFFNNPDVIDVYDKNFANCSALVRKRYRELIRISNQSGTCDRHALFYSLCAYSKLIQNCPASTWQNNRNCQQARNYMQNCAWPALKEFMKST